MPPSPKTNTFDNMDYNDKQTKSPPLTKIVAGVTVLATVLFLMYTFTLKPTTPFLQTPEWIHASILLKRARMRVHGENRQSLFLGVTLESTARSIFTKLDLYPKSRLQEQLLVLTRIACVASTSSMS